MKEGRGISSDAIGLDSVVGMYRIQEQEIA